MLGGAGVCLDALVEALVVLVDRLPKSVDTTWLSGPTLVMLTLCIGLL